MDKNRAAYMSPVCFPLLYDILFFCNLTGRAKASPRLRMNCDLRNGAEDKPLGEEDVLR